MKGKLTAVLFILVFILIAAGVFSVLTRLDSVYHFTGSPTPEPVSAAPTPIAAPVTTPFAAPANTPVPTPVVEPTPIPAPTLAPAPVMTPGPTSIPTTAPTTVPTTAPMQSSLGSGVFRSDTGALLDVQAEWSAQTLNDNQVQVTVTVSAISFGLHTQVLSNGVNIALDGQYVSLEQPRIDYDGGSQVTTKLATQSFTVDLPRNSSRAILLQVEWQYNGSYHGVDLPIIECGGMINLSR